MVSSLDQERASGKCRTQCITVDGAPGIPPRRIDILGLVWDEENEAHVEEHIAAWLVEELFEGGDYVRFPNKPGHPPNRRRVIGRTPGGFWVTAVIEEPADGDPTRWRPVTAWPSEPFERGMVEAARKRGGTKGRQ